MAADRPPRGLRFRLGVVLGVMAVLLLAGLVAQLVVQARLAERRDDLLDRIDPAVAAVSDLRAAVLDQETGARGYVLTEGDEDFLVPYARGEAAADEALDHLVGLLDDSPRVQDDMATIRAALGEWRTATAEPSVEDPAASAGVAFQDTGRRRFNTLRDAIDDLDGELAAERTEAVADLDEAYRNVLLLMFGVPAGLVALGVVIAAALSRLVISPLARLGRDARLVANGDLTHPVHGHGPPELVRMGEDVEAMRTRIVSELDQLNATTADLWTKAEELERSNADLEQFAYVASHDLQEPLRKVAGFCQLLEKRYGDELDERAREYIWFASDGARRMQDLINDLLAFSRVGRNTAGFVPVDLGEVAADVLAVFAEPVAEAGATVTVGDLPTVPGDRRLLAAVVQNLVSNALKFRGEDPPRVDIHASRAGGLWTITVADNGIGIEPQYADQIFTIFKRLHNKADYEGTGIGLALCKKIVEFHGGRVWLEPGDSGGTTFVFTLPAGDEPVPAPTEKADHDAD